jgi:histidinol-phosphate aminotransferase
MRTLEQLVCPHILKMEPYSSARLEFKGEASIYLDANENTIRRTYNRYPHPLQTNLKLVIKPLLNLEKEQIFLGNGSDESIDLLMRMFCVAGQDAIITLPPTYGMYKVSASLNNIEAIEIPLEANYQPNVAAILAAQNERTKILFVCSPNNPTGNDFDLQKIEELILGFDGIVVVDEAYIHFSTQASCVPLIEKYSNLIVLQTFSKAWGMAGIRLGMALANSAIIDLFNKIKLPYNVNVLTEEYALNELQDLTTIKQDIASILAEREQLKTQLAALSCVEIIYPSSANFLLIKVDQADQVYQFLVEKGIIVRNRSKVPLCANCLRITVGTKDENKVLIERLKAYVAANLIEK